MIRRIQDEELEGAIKLCFDIYIEETKFRKFACNYDLFLKNYIDISFEYYLKNKSNYYGYYIDGLLVGVIEVNNNYINQLVVKKEYRNNNIGRELVSFIEKEIDSIEVDAFYSSIPFYEKLGFVSINSLIKEKNSVKMRKFKK